MNHDAHNTDYLDELAKVDDDAEALTDEHVTGRLHDVLLRAYAERLPEASPLPPEACVCSARRPADSSEVQDLEERIEATRQRLHSVQASLREAVTRRDDVMRSLVFAERRIETARRRVVKVVPEDDAYLETILDLAREILDGAHDTAGRLITDARAEAQGIVAAAINRADRW
jgi:chromosome segregation ATPase